MGLKGRLTREKMATNVPIHAPTFGTGHSHYWKNARLLIFNYETDGEAAANLLPPQLELTDTPTASVFFNDMNWSTVGRYKEVAQVINCRHGKEEGHYCVHLVLDQEAAIIGGREFAGFPKKSGHIEFIQESDLMGGYFDRPSGIRICSGLMRSEKPMDMPPDGNIVKWFNVRAIPSPEEGGGFSLLELVQLDMIQHPIEMWVGTGNCYFTGASDFDPWHCLPAKRMLGCVFAVMDFDLGNGRILESL